VYVVAAPLVVGSIVGSVTSSLLHDPVKRPAVTIKLNIDFFILPVLNKLLIKNSRGPLVVLNKRSEMSILGSQP
jgi:hypothetical protein